ncbi:MAG: right-handed parallel beta-helix repeat-containing protein, partial [Chitinispirillaceae bacterium]|nr:right-handed parallel beta-helix repeat-containing protein [Chitinispirillaceae bacterium]
MKQRIIIFILGLSILLSLMMLCIKRDNPWDPYNGCHPEEIETYKNFYIRAIDSTLKALSSFTLWIEKMKDSLSFLQSNNEKILQQNNLINDSIKKILSYNSQIEEINKNRECENENEKKQIFPLYFSHLNIFNKNIEPIEKSIETTISCSESLIIASLDMCNGKKVLSDFYTDSVRNLHAVVKNSFNNLKESINKYNTVVSDSNKRIDSLNTFLEKEDSLISNYNRQISFCKMSRLSDPAQIKEAIIKLKEGDSLALDSGIIELQEFFISRKGSADKKITIIGSPTGRTILNSPNTVIENCKNIEFVNITFQNINGEVGVKVQNNSYQIAFNSCSFTNSKRYGCTIENSVVLMFNCKFEYNGTEVEDSLLIKQRAGIRAINCNTIVIKNSLIVDNKGFGIDILSSNAEIINCTIANNTLDGIRYIG